MKYIKEQIDKINIKDIFKLKKDEFTSKYNVFHSDKGIF
jgi:hypothetical protein